MSQASDHHRFHVRTDAEGLVKLRETSITRGYDNLNHPRYRHATSPNHHPKCRKRVRRRIRLAFSSGSTLRSTDSRPRAVRRRAAPNRFTASSCRKHQLTQTGTTVAAGKQLSNASTCCRADVNPPADASRSPQASLRRGSDGLDLDEPAGFKKARAHDGPSRMVIPKVPLEHRNVCWIVRRFSKIEPE